MEQLKLFRTKIIVLELFELPKKGRIAVDKARSGKEILNALVKAVRNEFGLSSALDKKARNATKKLAALQIRAYKESKYPRWEISI